MKSPEENKFGARLEAIFKALGTSAYAFAESNGFNRATLYNITTGRNKPGLDLLEQMCDSEPRISAEYLLRGVGEPLHQVNNKSLEYAASINLLFEFQKTIQATMNEYVMSKVSLMNQDAVFKD